MVVLVLVVFSTFGIADSHIPLLVKEVGRLISVTNLRNRILKKRRETDF